MARSYLEENVKKLVKICSNNGYEIEIINQYQYRVFGATHIIDIWPSRMKYHRINGEVIDANEYYYKLDSQLNEKQVEMLLSTGKPN